MLSFKIIGLLILEKKIFTIYGHNDSWSCDLDHLNFRSPFPRRLHMKFGFVVSEMFEDCEWMPTPNTCLYNNYRNIIFDAVT